MYNIDTIKTDSLTVTIVNEINEKIKNVTVADILESIVKSDECSAFSMFYLYQKTTHEELSADDKMKLKSIYNRYPDWISFIRDNNVLFSYKELENILRKK